MNTPKELTLQETLVRSSLLAYAQSIHSTIPAVSPRRVNHIGGPGWVFVPTTQRAKTLFDPKMRIADWKAWQREGLLPELLKRREVEVRLTDAGPDGKGKPGVGETGTEAKGQAASKSTSADEATTPPSPKTTNQKNPGPSTRGSSGTTKPTKPIQSTSDTRFEVQIPARTSAASSPTPMSNPKQIHKRMKSNDSITSQPTPKVRRLIAQARRAEIETQETLRRHEELKAQAALKLSPNRRETRSDKNPEPQEKRNDDEERELQRELGRLRIENKEYKKRLRVSEKEHKTLQIKQLSWENEKRQIMREFGLLKNGAALKYQELKRQMEEMEKKHREKVEALEKENKALKEKVKEARSEGGKRSRIKVEDSE